ncbi:MAG TPA: hypothetical protein VIC62_15815, partial [Nakamurella sp.]
MRPRSLSGVSGQASTSVAPPPTPPRRRRRWPWVVLGLFVLVPVVTLVVAVVFWLTNDPVLASFPAGPPQPPEFTVPFLDVAPDSAVPTAPMPAPASVPGRADPQALWIARVSAHTDIPTRVLKAYVDAAATTAKRDPACHLT